MNPESLFADETLISATFSYGARGVAMGLDPGSTKANLEPGQAVKVPLWLIPDLFKRAMVTIQMPEVYNERYQRKMNAGAECVSLRNKAQFFYDVGNRCGGFLSFLDEKVAQIIDLPSCVPLEWPFSGAMQCFKMLTFLLSSPRHSDPVTSTSSPRASTR